jgi:hypothetical protein
MDVGDLAWNLEPRVPTIGGGRARHRAPNPGLRDGQKEKGCSLICRWKFSHIMTALQVLGQDLRGQGPG